MLNAEEAKNKQDLRSMLSSLQGLSDEYVKKREEEQLSAQPETKVRAVCLFGRCAPIPPPPPCPPPINRSPLGAPAPF
jgi:hypothetical protein